MSQPRSASTLDSDKSVAKLIGQLFEISNTIWIYTSGKDAQGKIGRCFSFKTIEDADKFKSTLVKYGEGKDDFIREHLVTLQILPFKDKETFYYQIHTSERGYNVIKEALLELKKLASSQSVSSPSNRPK